MHTCNASTLEAKVRWQVQGSVKKETDKTTESHYSNISQPSQESIYTARQATKVQDE